MKSFFLLLLLLELTEWSLQSSSLDFTLGPDNCAEGEYFNSASYACVSCGTDLNPTADGLSCTCAPGFKKNLEVGASPYSLRGATAENAFQCEACPADQEASPDGWDCVACASGTTFDTASSQCGDCTNEDFLYVRNPDGALVTPSCTSCDGPAFRLSDEEDRCERCPSDIVYNLADTDTKCVCPGDLINGVLCAPSSYNQVLSLYLKIYYSESQVQDSPLLRDNLESKFVNCSFYRDIASCQVLANFCALSFYVIEDETPSVTGATACDLLDVAADNSPNEDLPSTVPSVVYTDGELAALSDNPEDYTMDTGRDSDWVRLSAFKYDINGNFLGFVEGWKTGAFQLCKGDAYSLKLAFRFAKNSETKCKLRVRELIDSFTTEFFDLVILFKANNDDTDKIYSFPISVENDQRVSASFYRRLFLVDNVSGGGGTEGILGSYASSVTLFYTTESLIDSTPITNPTGLVIKYSPLTQADYDSDATVSTEFNVYYDQKYQEFNRSIGISVGVLGGMVLIYSLIKINGWRKRAGAATIDLFALIKFMFAWFGVTANLFFVILFLTGLYLLLTWRNQEVLFILLPYTQDRGDIRPFIGYFWTGFLAKVIEILHIIYSQCNVDIFFIDWERPKTTGKKSADGRKLESNVSIWRTYFVANEWNEIQTIRKTNVVFQLMAVVFFLEVLNFKEFARADPSNPLFPDYDYVNSPYDTFLRFAVGSSVYVAIGVVQYLFEILFYSRFIEDPFNQFVDLCSISNVSCFIMSQKQFGYYIHGRSVHGFADANLAQLSLLMQKEQDDLRGTRGLLPDSTVQTFEMVVPTNLRTAYRKLFKPPLPSNAAKAATTADQSGVDRGALSQLDPQMRKSIEGYTQLNAFLAAFINRDIPDCDYEVRERPFLEKIMDMEFQEVSDHKGVFYNDGGHSFDKVLFYGNEFSLFIFDVFLFCAIDYMLVNFLLSAILVYVVQKILVPIREVLSQRNLARKTLVDERFLI